MNLEVTDIESIKEFLKDKLQLIKTFRDLKKIIKQNEDLLTRGIKGINLNTYQAIWEKYFSEKAKGGNPIEQLNKAQAMAKEKPDDKLVAKRVEQLSRIVPIYKSLKPKVALEPIKKLGPNGAYVSLIDTMIKVANKADILEEQEVSAAFAEIIKRYNSVNKALIMQMKNLRKNPYGKDNQINATTIKYIYETADKLRDILLEVKEEYDDLKGEKASPEVSPEGAGDQASGTSTEQPQKIDPSPEMINDLREKYTRFKEKFYCRIDANASSIERREAQETCQKAGVAVTQNQQYDIISDLLNVLSKIIKKEEQEAYQDKTQTEMNEEVSPKTITAWKEDVETFITAASSVGTALSQVQKYAGKTAGTQALKAAKPKLENLAELTGVLYGDLNNLSDQLTIKEEKEVLVEDYKEVKRIYYKVLASVSKAIELIGDSADIDKARPNLQDSVKDLKAVLQYFEKGKGTGGEVTAANISDEYQNAIRNFGEDFSVLLSLSSEISSGGATVVKRAAQKLKLFATELKRMFGLPLPKQFADKIEPPKSPEETPPEQKPDEQEPEVPKDDASSEEETVITTPRDLKRIFNRGRSSIESINSVLKLRTESEYDSLIKFYVLINSPDFTLKEGKYYSPGTAARFMAKGINIDKDKIKKLFVLMTKRMPVVYKDIASLLVRAKPRQLKLIFMRLNKAAKGKKFDFKTNQIFRIADLEIEAEASATETLEEKLDLLLTPFIKQQLRGK